MTVWRSESISAIVTRRHRWAMCLGSDWRRNSKFPYFCVFSSFGKKPSCSSAASSKWFATSFCCGGLLALASTTHKLGKVPPLEPCDSGSTRLSSNLDISHPSQARSFSWIARKFSPSTPSVSFELYNH